MIILSTKIVSNINPHHGLAICSFLPWLNNKWNREHEGTHMAIQMKFDKDFLAYIRTEYPLMP